MPSTTEPKASVAVIAAYGPVILRALKLHFDECHLISTIGNFDGNLTIHGDIICDDPKVGGDDTSVCLSMHSTRFFSSRSYLNPDFRKGGSPTPPSPPNQ